MQPTKVADFKPRYPENLQAAKVGGVVTLEALIGTDGTVREVHLVNGDPDLGAAAADAIRQWEFSPTYLNCTPVEVHMGVTANFVAK
jgi:protein TonB